MLSRLIVRSFVNHYPFKIFTRNGLAFTLNNEFHVSTQDSITEDFWEKNKRLKRPMSPFTIYKIQLTSLMSISHRLTGIALSIVVYGFGLSQFVASNNFINQLSYIQSTVPASILLTLKSIIVTSFAYHLFAGIRHLVWDIGHGFSRKHVYATSYIVLMLTLLSLIGSFYYLQ